MLGAFVRYCVLLDCKSFIPIDCIPLFVIHVWHPSFPLNGIKKYLTIHEGGHIGSRSGQRVWITY